MQFSVLVPIVATGWLVTAEAELLKLLLGIKAYGAGVFCDSSGGHRAGGDVDIRGDGIAVYLLKS